MSTPAKMRERQDRILAELSELGLALARDLQARALAAPDVSDASELGLAFQRVARSVRQTLALEAKFERDRQSAAREVAEDVKWAANERADRRRAQVKIAVERAIQAEKEFPINERLIDDLEERLIEDELYREFHDDKPVEDHIDRLCAELGVTPPEWIETEAETAPTASSSPIGGGGGEAAGGGFHSNVGMSPEHAPGGGTRQGWRSSA